MSVDIYSIYDTRRQEYPLNMTLRGYCLQVCMTIAFDFLQNLQVEHMVVYRSSLEER